MFEFILEKTSGKARAGIFKTPYGIIPTPIFMPVGTVATVKAMSPLELKAIGAQIILSNTYHNYIRPGTEIIKKAGNLHQFMSWDRPILTDSGGFQVMSLAKLRKITDDGVRFQSHIDGSYHFLTPEKVISIQNDLGGDIIMSFDECPPYNSGRKYLAQSVERTLNWAKRGKIAHQNIEQQALFGIIQGGVDEDLRLYCAEKLMDLDFSGYSIGGLAVGEPANEMYRITHFLHNILPPNKPRYLMGVGTPANIIQNIGHGIDMFDCVMPTRNARKGSIFTWKGKMIIKAARYKNDFRPIDDNCRCYACQNFSRAYIRHLIQMKEILGMRLATIHSLFFYLELTQKIRESILKDQFMNFYHQYFDLLDRIVEDD